MANLQARFTENNGNLILQIPEFDKVDKGEIQEILDNLEQGNYTYSGAFYAICEYELCNGWHLVMPETIGALTDGFILSDTLIDDETTEEELKNAKFYWDSDYAIKDVVRALLNGEPYTFYGDTLIEIDNELKPFEINVMKEARRFRPIENFILKRYELGIDYNSIAKDKLLIAAILENLSQKGYSVIQKFIEKGQFKLDNVRRAGTRLNFLEPCIIAKMFYYRDGNTEIITFTTGYDNNNLWHTSTFDYFNSLETFSEHFNRLNSFKHRNLYIF